MNDLMQEWTKWNQFTLESWKNATDTYIDLIDNGLIYWSKPSAFAELSMESIRFSEQLENVYSDTINQLLQVQLKFLNLDTTSEATKNLSDIYLASVTNLGAKQVELMQMLIDTITEHLKILQTARKPADLIAVQVNLATQLQQNLKTSTIDTLGVLNSIKEAWENWTYKTLSAIAKENSV